MRTRPVARSEIRLHFVHWDVPQIRAVPFDACRRTLAISPDPEGYCWGDEYEPTPELFKEVLAEVRREWRAYKGLKQKRPPEVSGYTYAGYPQTCRGCGATFVAVRHNQSARPGYFCSNACVDRATKRITARVQAAVVRRRSEKRREARADLKCQHCGTALAAERGSKRYCSGTCRVAALRARRHNQPAYVEP